MSRRISRKTVLILVAALAPLSAHAATFTWDGQSSGTWSDASNWSTNIAPTSDRDTTLIFGLSPDPGGYTATNDRSGKFRLNTLQINASTAEKVIAGNPLEFLWPANGAPGNPKIDVRATTGTTRIQNDLFLRNDTFVSANIGNTYLEGDLTGPGALVFTRATPTFQLLGNNTYAGGTWVQSGTLRLTANQSFGTGAINVGDPPPPALFTGTTSPAYVEVAEALPGFSDGRIRVGSAGAIVLDEFTPSRLRLIEPTSTGVLALPGSPTTTDERVYADAIDLSKLPSLRIAPRDNKPVRLTGAITPAGDTYRFGGTNAATTPYASGLPSPVLTIDSQLTDGATPRSANLSNAGFVHAGVLKLTNPSNTYSGGTFIDNPGTSRVSALLIDSTASPGQTPLGTGPVTVAGQLLLQGNGTLANLANTFAFQPGSEIHLYNGAGLNTDRLPDAMPLALNGTQLFVHQGTGSDQVVETTGPITYSAGSRLAVFSRTNATAVGVQAASLQRADRGTLALSAVGTINDLGNSSRFAVTDTAGLTDSAGMIHPHIVADVRSSSEAPHFLRLDPGGLFRRANYWFEHNQTAPTNSIINWSTTPFPQIGSEIHALRVTSSYTMDNGKTLTIASGGLIASQSITTLTSGGAPSTLRFGRVGTNTEAVVWVPAGSSSTITPIVEAPGGLTLSGGGTLTINNPNITGPITVNGGTLQFPFATPAGPYEVNAGSISVGNLPENSSLVLRPGTSATSWGLLPDVRLDAGAFLSFSSKLTLKNITGTGEIRGPLATVPLNPVPQLTFATDADRTFSGTIRQNGGSTIDLAKAGPGTLTLDGQLFYSGTVSVQQGTLRLDADNDRTAAAPTYNLIAGSKLVFNASHRTLQLQGTSGDVEIGSAGQVRFAARMTLNNLTLRPGGQLHRSASTTSAFQRLTHTLNTLTMEDGATFDLLDDKLAVVSGDLPRVNQLVAAGLGDGDWTGAGLTSSLAEVNPLYGLAAIRNSDDGVTPLFTTFGTAVNASSVLVAYTLDGDSDLNGKIDADDYHRIDRGFLEGRTGYRFGDIDYNNAINLDDYALIDAAYLGQPTPAAAPAITSGVVPEPGTLGVLTCGAPLLLRRRRRS